MSLHRSIHATHLIHENLSIVMTFAYSRESLSNLLDRNFAGEWKYLYKALFDISEERAARSLLELALLIRIVDDAEGISAVQRQLKSDDFGTIIKPNGAEEPLYLRDMTNKIIHAARFEWNLDVAKGASVITFPSNQERWSRAVIELRSLAAFCGMLGG